MVESPGENQFIYTHRNNHWIRQEMNQPETFIKKVLAKTNMFTIGRISRGFTEVGGGKRGVHGTRTTNIITTIEHEIFLTL